MYAKVFKRKRTTFIIYQEIAKDLNKEGLNRYTEEIKHIFIVKSQQKT